MITHSDHMKEELLQHGVAEGRVFKIPFLAVTSGFGTPHTLRDEGAVTLVFAGRMEPDKGGQYLIAAAPIVARALQRPVQLVFAGNGRAENEWRNRVRDLNSEETVSVDFRGWVSSADLEQLYAQADLLVVPSLWPEPFGQVGPEAASHGLPAAAFRVGGVTEWLKEGRSGHVAAADPPSPDRLATAIVQCLADSEHYAALSRGALREAGEQSEARHLLALTDLLKQTLDRAQKSR